MKKEKTIALSLLDKPVMTMNGAEFLELLQQVEIPTVVEQPLVSNYPNQRPFIAGIKCVADYFETSKANISRMKADGVLDEAILQHGKTVIFDTYKMAEVLRLSNKKKKLNRKN